jgi:preprotein translocase subunit YajC
MGYNEEIERTEHQLEKLRKGKIKFQKYLETLKVGDEVYIEGGSGGFTMDYFPQEILEIDIPNCKIKAIEKSINETRWLTSFHAFENGKFVYHD